MRKLVCGLVRPSRVENLLLFVFVGIPLSVEVIIEVVLVSLLCRGDFRGVFELVVIPLSVEVIVGVLALCLSLY